jgi:tRNA(Ile)-lysidine synthase
MWKKVIKQIDSENLIIPGSRILVAVSGGPDSVALLWIMANLRERYDISLIAAHYNHRWRGDESDRDEAKVSLMCKELEVPLTLGQGSSRPGKAKQSESAARTERYHFLRMTAQAQGAARIALGHNADDQAETVLMNVLRGSGVSGLKGMLPLKDELFLRPLLGVTRREILAFLAREKLSYCKDSTNDDEAYLRNRVRHSLIPLLTRNYSSRIKRHLLKLAGICRDEDHFLDQEAERYLKGCHLGNPSSLVLKNFLKQHTAVQRRVVRKLMAGILSPHKEPVFNQVEPIIQFLHQQENRRLMIVGRKWQLQIAAADVHISYLPTIPSPPKTSLPAYCYLLEIPGDTRLEEINRILRVRLIDKRDYDDNLEGDSCCLYLDYDAPRLPLRVRTRLPGDRMIFPGMKGRKSLKKFFNEQNFSPAWRLLAPLVVDENSTVVAIPALRISDRVKITASTQRILKLEMV